jgi:rRNA processing protein Gar1
MDKARKRNVVRLADYCEHDIHVRARQEVVARSLTNVMNGAKPIPVAYVGAVVDVNGEVSTVTCLVEPEYVPALAEELTALVSRLLAFARTQRSHPPPILKLRSD